MKDFFASYCHRYDERVNDDLFTRKFDHPMAQFAIDTCKNLEVLPAITLVDWELITDQTKIRSPINKDLAKDPKIRSNRSLERLVTAQRTVYDLLVFHFHVSAKGQEADVIRKLRVPKQVRGPYYVRNGKKVLMLIQIVDNSTFVKGNVLNFKSTLYPIKLSPPKHKYKMVDGETLSLPTFRLDLFKKLANPLLYYLASYGMEDTLEFFGLQDMISVVDDTLDEDHYRYIKINDSVYLEMHEKLFQMHPFTSRFIGTLADVLIADKSKITLADVYSSEYWLGRLAEVFSKKRNVNKGERVLISFRKLIDPYTKARLKLKRFHKRNTAAVIRWMMVNYDELIKKDSNDLINKRMRANETQAYFFDNYITRNVYSLLNTDNPPFEKYLRLLNSINEFTLMRSSSGNTSGSSISSMLRYERYNDFDAIELARYTLKGPTGLNGGKKKTSLRYRDIYPSHLGRYDVNVCSSTDPGLTGYLTANVQFDEMGYFSGNVSEPDVYDSVIDAQVKRYAEEGYRAERDRYIKLQLSRDSSGYFRLQHRMSDDQLRTAILADPWAYGLYPSDQGFRMIPKIDTGVDPQGYIHLVRRVPGKRRKRDTPLERNSDGYLVLKPVVTKMELQKFKRRKRKD